MNGKELYSGKVKPCGKKQNENFSKLMRMILNINPSQKTEDYSIGSVRSKKKVQLKVIAQLTVLTISGNVKA
jgi:hypothetical protein